MASRLRWVPWRRSPKAVRPLMVALYLSRSRRWTRVWIGSAGWARAGWAQNAKAQTERSNALSMAGSYLHQVAAHHDITGKIGLYRIVPGLFGNNGPATGNEMRQD